MNIDKYLQQVKAKGIDMSKPSAGGGGEDYTPPVEGACMLRFVGYVEIGRQKDSYQGQEKIVPKAMLVFELHGKNYPLKEFNGEKVAQRITVKETISTSPKSNFFKLFTAMRGASGATHIAELLGKPFKGRVIHSKWQKDGKDLVTAKLRDESGYSIGLPTFEDPETGEVRTMNVPPQVSKTRLFLWDFATKEMWDNITLPGERQPFVEAIKAAVNFEGSPAQAALMGLTVEDIERPVVRATSTSAPQAAPVAQSSFRSRFRAGAAPAAPQPAAPAPDDGEDDPFGDV